MKQTTIESRRKAAAQKFASHWAGHGYEKGETQKFWLSLLRDVYGIEKLTDYIQFEEKVRLGHASFIDARIPSAKVLIEQKSEGVDLSKPALQSDKSVLTPFQQARRYYNELPYDQRARFIVTCNFQT
ncbi:MAG: hypothetical protein IJU32_05360 [Pyramidobacter sp.]|nr:hypothetical protein [Pyramidobacter sp.]